MSEQKEYFALSDEVIFQFRELIQMAMLTGTNLVDHLRQVRMERSPEDPSRLALTTEYKDYHLKVIDGLLAEVEKVKKEIGIDVADA